MTALDLVELLARAGDRLAELKKQAAEVDAPTSADSENIPQATPGKKESDAT